MLLPHGLGNFGLQLENVKAIELESYIRQGARVARVALAKRRRHDPEQLRFIDSEYDHQILGAVRVGQPFDLLLFRQTGGTRRRSDETGRALIDDLGARGFNALANRETRDVVSLAQDDRLFALQRCHCVLTQARASPLCPASPGFFSIRKETPSKSSVQRPKNKLAFDRIMQRSISPRRIASAACPM